MNSERKQVIPGVWITRRGQVIADDSLNDTLCDLALELEEEDDYPVDVQHILAAVVLAVQQGEIDSDRVLSSDDPELRKILSPYVRKLFEQFGGEICDDD